MGMNSSLIENSVSD